MEIVSFPMYNTKRYNSYIVQNVFIVFALEVLGRSHDGIRLRFVEAKVTKLAFLING